MVRIEENFKNWQSPTSGEHQMNIITPGESAEESKLPKVSMNTTMSDFPNMVITPQPYQTLMSFEKPDMKKNQRNTAMLN